MRNYLRRILEGCIFVLTKTQKIMKTEIMKERTEKELVRMGCSLDEAKALIEKYWIQASYLKRARDKAFFMTA